MTVGERWVRGAVGSGPHRLQIGLKALAPEQWIEDQADFAEQLRARQDLVLRHRDVLARLPGQDDAENELLDLLFEHLPGALPQHYGRQADVLVVHPTGDRWPRRELPTSPLEAIARLVPDDLCILRPGPDRAYRLVSAAVCFPTRWRLAPKLGQGLDGIHAPVPGYARRLGRGVEQVFEALQVERPLWRVNWSLVDSPALYQPVRIPARIPPAPEVVGRDLWVRSERQTLRRLPVTGAVVFSIRIRQMRLADACTEDPECALRILEQLETMADEMLRYKALADVRPLLCDYLREMAAASANEDTPAGPQAP